VHVFVTATKEKAAAPEQSGALKTSSVAARAAGAAESASASASVSASDGDAAIFHSAVCSTGTDTSKKVGKSK